MFIPVVSWPSAESVSIQSPHRWPDPGSRLGESFHGEHPSPRSTRSHDRAGPWAGLRRAFSAWRPSPGTGQPSWPWSSWSASPFDHDRPVFGLSVPLALQSRRATARGLRSHRPGDDRRCHASSYYSGLPPCVGLRAAGHRKFADGLGPAHNGEAAISADRDGQARKPSRPASASQSVPGTGNMTESVVSDSPSRPAEVTCVRVSSSPSARSKVYVTSSRSS